MISEELITAIHSLERTSDFPRQGLVLDGVRDRDGPGL